MTARTGLDRRSQLNDRTQWHHAFAPQLPASYNAFVVGINGEVQAGATAEVLVKGAVGWTEPLGDGASVLSLRAGNSGARLLLYAGQPQNISVVAQGPFIAGSREELTRYYAAYRQGQFPRAGTMRPVTHPLGVSKET